MTDTQVWCLWNLWRWSVSTLYLRNIILGFFHVTTPNIFHLDILFIAKQARCVLSWLCKLLFYNLCQSTLLCLHHLCYSPCPLWGQFYLLCCRVWSWM